MIIEPLGHSSLEERLFYLPRQDFILSNVFSSNFAVQIYVCRYKQGT